MVRVKLFWTRAKTLDKAKDLERVWLQALAWWQGRSVSIANTRKRVATTASRREGVYNRTGEPSVTFCGEEEQ